MDVSMTDTPPTAAHPPLIPYIRPEELPAEFSWQARAVLQVMCARTLAFGADMPQWRIRRRFFFIGGHCFAQGSDELAVAGWRRYQPDTPKSLKPFLPGENALAEAGVDDEAPRALQHVETVAVSRTITLADVLDFAATHQLARPSSYADLLQWLIDEDIVVSQDDASVTAAGRTLLKQLRGERVPGALFREHQADEHQLGEIEAGRAPACSVLRDERLPGLSALGHLIDGLVIHDEPAAASYADRDARAALLTPWDGAKLPVALNPEYQIPPDDPRREQRRSIARQASERHGRLWASMDEPERVLARISILAEGSAREWMDAHQFDLYARWLVGWVPGMALGSATD